MIAMQKTKIESIFPLTVMQKAFLFHHLKATKDEGILQVKLVLEGDLDVVLLKESWQSIVQRHAALRTSVHWKKLEKPVQVIHKEAKLPIEVLDWADLSKVEFEQNLNAIKGKHSINLSKVSVSEILLIKQKETRYILLWNCHHLLLDGWSASNIIKDVFSFYNDLHHNRIPPHLKAIPPYKTYLNWVHKQNEADAKLFWNNAIKKNQTSVLFNKINQEESNFKNFVFTISAEQTVALKTFAQQHRLTIGTIIKGLWSLLINKYMNSETATFGVTVSGRSIPIPNIEYMAGLFMNVLPVQMTLAPETSFLDWLKKQQIIQGKSIAFEHNTINQILNWVDAKEATLFDTLLVFENFPWEELKSGEVEVKEFQGGLTTTYPLTLIIKPSQSYEFTLRYDEKNVSANAINWFANSLESLVDTTINTGERSLDKLMKNIADPVRNQKINSLSKNNLRHSKELSARYVPPKNEIELKLTKIWEGILGLSTISTNDNFFDIGGKSLQAVRLMGKIAKEFGFNLPPTILLKDATIHQLANIIIGTSKIPSWSSIVPLRASGKRPPLFCIHAGGGHTFFYNGLIQYLEEEQPVYSVQPHGLESIDKLHNSIEEMTAEYLHDIKKIQPHGPYIILCHCFSIMVGIEIIRQLRMEGQEEVLLINVDTPFPKDLLLEKVKLSLWEKLKYPFTLTRFQIYEFVSFRIERWIDIAKQEKSLKPIVENLTRLYLAYQWKPVKSKKVYIRSEHYLKKVGKEDETNWKTIFLEGIEVYNVKGRHRDLFTEPNIQGLSQQLQISLDKFNENWSK